MDDTGVVAPVKDDPHEEGALRFWALRESDGFVVCDPHGDITGGPDGLFDSDTRLLSKLRLLIGGRRPTVLSTAVSSDNVVFTFNGANRPLPPTGGRVVPPGVLHVERRRLIWKGRLYERIRITNHGLDEVLAPVGVEFAVDFRDMFEVRGDVRRKRGEIRAPALNGRGVDFAYRGLDGVERTSAIAFSEAPQTLSASRAEFMAWFEPKGHFELFLEVADRPDAPPGKMRFERAAAEARTAMRRRARHGAHPRTDSPSINRWLEQSRSDLALLTSELPTGRYPFAGIPWFSTPFGRDGLITAWQRLLFDPGLARGVLAYLASRQATEVSAFRDAQPGKIMHETRQGEMAALGEVPFGLYYGGVDSTPLFVALAGAYARRTGDLPFILSIWPALQAAAAWVHDYGDSNGDGLIDYARAADTGLANQGWKDSYDSVFHADGRFPKGPIALVEVQGYAYAAWRAMAEMAGRLGEPGAEEWSSRAEAVREAVENRFWMEEEGFYGVAVDGEGQLCRPLTSNAGHLLFCGLPAPDRAARVIRRMVSAEFRTGWGLRTLARREARFNPMSYHNGSVWPHDTAINIAGMARYGERDEVGALVGDLHGAASNMDMRLPELFCGFRRRAGEPPVPYPVSCSPQAWAAGSPFMVLQALLGVSVDAFARTVTIVRPRLPDGVNHLRLAGLEIAGCKVDLDFERVREGLVVAAANNCSPELKVSTVW